MATEHKKSCQVCGEFISLSAYKCRFCGEKQEEIIDLRFKSLIFSTSLCGAVLFWIIPPFFAYSFIVEDMDSLYSNFGYALNVAMAFVVIFYICFMFIVFNQKISIPFLEKWKRKSFLTEAGQLKASIDQTRKGLVFCWVISISVGIGLVFMMSYLQRNRPAEEEFAVFLDSHPTYSVTELIKYRQENFCTFYLLGTNKEHVNYVGFGSSFIMIPYLPGYWAYVSESNRKRNLEEATR